MKIDFEFITEHGTFRDAIYLPDDHTLSDEEIEQLKQERFNNWIEACNSTNEEDERVDGE